MNFSISTKHIGIKFCLLVYFFLKSFGNPILFCRWGGKEKQETKQKQNIKELKIHTESSFKRTFPLPSSTFHTFMISLVICGSEITFTERQALQWMRCCEKIAVLSKTKPYPFVNSTSEYFQCFNLGK